MTGINENDEGFVDLEVENMKKTSVHSTATTSGNNNNNNSLSLSTSLSKLLSVEEERELNALKKANKKTEFDDKYDNKEMDKGVVEGEEDENQGRVNALKASKELSEYELENLAVKERQNLLNKKEFEGMSAEERMTYTGYPSGYYVRIEFSNIPYEFVKNFDPSAPVLIGGLLATEQTLGFVQVRIKRHRWYPKTLKTNDPLIFSIGWRRYQSVPLFRYIYIYTYIQLSQLLIFSLFLSLSFFLSLSLFLSFYLFSTEDTSSRHRMLKYTPEHMHCYATFYGPSIPPNTGILAYQSLSNAAPYFRVAATGTVVEVDSSFKGNYLSNSGYVHPTGYKSFRRCPGGVKIGGEEKLIYSLYVYFNYLFSI